MSMPSELNPTSRRDATRTASQSHVAAEGVSRLHARRTDAAQPGWQGDRYVLDDAARDGIGDKGAAHPPSNCSPDRVVPSRRGERGAVLSALAWTPNAELEYRNWVVEGRRIGAIGRGSPWWLGDWLHYGISRWGERYRDAVKITGYDAKSLRNMRYVASRFELSLRRDSLTWSHHALLAAMEPEEQSYWLDRAAAKRFSVEDLRVELRSARRGRYAVRARDAESLIGGQAGLCPQCGHDAPLTCFIPPGASAARPYEGSQ